MSKSDFAREGLAELMADPGGVTRRIERRVKDLRHQLTSAEESLDLARQFIQITTKWDQKADEDRRSRGTDDPTSAPERQPSGQTSTDRNATENGSVPMWIRVRNLMGQDDRWWKVGDVAEALGIDNRRSLRVAMENAVKRKRLIKGENAFYRLPDHPEHAAEGDASMR